MHLNGFWNRRAAKESSIVHAMCYRGTETGEVTRDLVCWQLVKAAACDGQIGRASHACTPRHHLLEAHNCNGDVREENVG